MIGGISKHMHQWITNLIDNRTVKFGILTSHDQLHLLVELLGEITDHTWEPVHYALDWNHSNLHNRFMQIRCDTL